VHKKYLTERHYCERRCFNNAAQRIATWLLERNAVHVIASDAHDDKYRKPILSEARDAVSRSFGADFAQALVLENPAAIIAGLPLPSSRETSRDTFQKFLGKIG
jgi:protein-tyrosine phosphatase